MHIVSDDWNIDDESVAFCEKYIGRTEDEYGPELAAAERACFEAIKVLSQPERASALALGRFWDSDCLTNSTTE